MLKRIEYEMTLKEEEEILDACKPVRYMVIGGIPPRSPQENANAAWENLGKKRGFKHMTVKLDPKGRQRFFTAEKE